MEPENKILLLPSIVSALSSYETSRALIAMLIKLKHSRNIALREHFRPVIATQSHKEITHYEEESMWVWSMFHVLFIIKLNG